MRKVFDSLDSRPYLGEEERCEFRFYHAFFESELDRIGDKLREGRIRPLDLRGFPRTLNYPEGPARVGIFIGSFDPFQMTHLAAALRFMAAPNAEVDIVYVVPEGSVNPQKPNKSEYAFRYDLLSLQLHKVFRPLILPLDIGGGRDTIGIVNSLIDLHAGRGLKLTHLIGSDTLPVATRFLPEDLEIWNARAAEKGVALDHGIHVHRRDALDALEPYGATIQSLGVRFTVDDKVMGSPSSTDFRASRHITIVFPTDEVLSRLELLFRYGMNRSWMFGETGPSSATCNDYEI